MVLEYWFLPYYWYSSSILKCVSFFKFFRRETLSMLLGRLRVEVRPIGRIDEASSQAHWCQTLQVWTMWAEFFTIRSFGASHEKTSELVKLPAIITHMVLHGPEVAWRSLKVPEGPQRSSWIIDLAYVCCDDLRSMLTTLWTSLDTIKSCFFPSSHLCCLTLETNSSIKLRTIENVTVQQPPDDTLLWWRLFCFPQSLTACAST